jgi:hypothetical protein
VVEQRYRAVLEVLSGIPVIEVAERPALTPGTGSSAKPLPDPEPPMTQMPSASALSQGAPMNSLP